MSVSKSTLSPKDQQSCHLKPPKSSCKELAKSGVYKHCAMSIVKDHPTLEEYAVKVRDGEDLVAKFDGKKYR